MKTLILHLKGNSMQKSTIFIDFDNIYITLSNINPELATHFACNPSVWMKILEEPESGEKRKFLVRRCYLNPDAFGKFRKNFTVAAFDVIDCPAITAQGKTTTDMQIAIDVLDKLNHTTRFDEFVLLSADADFTPLLKRLREYDRRTSIVFAGSASATYKASADCVLEIHEILNKSNPNQSSSSNIAVDNSVNQEILEKIRNMETSDDYILSFLLNTIINSGKPVPCSTVLDSLKKEFPSKANNWFGHGKAAKFFEEIDIESAGILYDKKSPGLLSLSEKHEFRTPIESDLTEEKIKNEIGEDVFNVAKRICNIVFVKLLNTSEYLTLLTFISNMMTRHPLLEKDSLSKYREYVHEFALSEEIKISKKCIFRMFYFIYFDREKSINEPTADGLIASYAAGLKYQCAQHNWNMTDEELSLVHRWLGFGKYDEQSESLNKKSISFLDQMELKEKMEQELHAAKMATPPAPENQLPTDGMI